MMASWSVSVGTIGNLSGICVSALNEQTTTGSSSSSSSSFSSSISPSPLRSALYRGAQLAWKCDLNSAHHSAGVNRLRCSWTVRVNPCADSYTWARRFPKWWMISRRSRPIVLSPRALYVDDDDAGGAVRQGSYLVDADESDGDGFSFSGGKYSKESGPYDKWIARGKRVNAYPIGGDIKKSRDPVFGLAMGEESQIKGESLEWFYVEEGGMDKPPVLLLHGIPSQAYSFRNVIPALSQHFRVIAPDWIGFGFSEKPQPGYGFQYTLPEYTAALGYLIDALELDKVSLVVQGFLAPAVVKYVSTNPERVDKMVLLNAPVLPQHTKLPASLAQFTGFLLGEIFAQDPIKASDGVLNDCGPYLLDENDSMVYRRPYLTSGMAGFALTAISRALKKELKDSVEELRRMLTPIAAGNCRPTIVWGLKDRWLRSEGVREFAESVGARYVELREVGHHAQEDYAEEVAKALLEILRKKA